MTTRVCLGEDLGRNMRGEGAWGLLLVTAIGAVGCGSSAKNPNGGGSGASADAGGGSSGGSTGGSGGAGKSQGGSASDAGAKSGGASGGAAGAGAAGVGGGAAGEVGTGGTAGAMVEPAPTRVIVQGEAEENDTTDTGLWSFNVDGSGGVALCSVLVYGFSVSKLGDRVLINGIGDVRMIDPNGENRLDIDHGGLGARISPSGKYFAFINNDGSTTYQLLVAASDGSAPKLLSTRMGEISWDWDPNDDVLMYATDETIVFYDVASGTSTSIDDPGAEFLLGVAASPDGTKLLYQKPGSTGELVRIWDRKTGTAVTAYEGLILGTSVIWNADSTAFVMLARKIPNYFEGGVLAAESSGANATFIPDADSIYGFSSERTFVVRTASGALEARELGASQGTALFPSFTNIAVGDGFVASCAHPSGVLTLVNDDGSNRHPLEGTFECQGRMDQSGPFVTAWAQGFTKIVVFHDMTTPPQDLPAPAAGGSVQGILQRGAGFTLGAPGVKSSWVYRKQGDFVLAHPNLPLFNIGSGVLVP